MKAFNLLLSSLLLLTACSDSNNTKIEYSVVINAPLKIVWDYNADNSNAQNWSIFFAKIAACPLKDCPSNKGLAPLDEGFIRRCYRNENEEGLFWDEITLEIKTSPESSYRKILAYNFSGYPLDMFKEKMEFEVEQFYLVINDQTTELKFSTRLNPFSKIRANNDLNKYNDSNWIEENLISFFSKIGKKRALAIFKKNLENIKHAIEKREQYKRKHPYTKFCDTKSFFCSKKLSDF